MEQNIPEKSAMTLRLPKSLELWIVNEANEFGIGKGAMIIMLLQQARRSSRDKVILND